MGLTLVALAATALTLASPATAADCSGDTGVASVQSITVAPLYVRGDKTDFPVPVTVAVCDPANLVRSGDAVLGVKVLDPLAPGAAVLDYDFDTMSPAGTGDVKSYSFTVVSFYEPDYRQQVYGSLDVGASIYDGPGVGANTLDSMIVHTSFKSRLYLTNAPSATTVKKGSTTVIRGVLRRFDGAPMANQRVAVKVVPAGWTHGSFAGYARTTSTGAFALTVRAYYTGSWVVNYAGDATAVSSYKGAWVRVTP